MKNFAILRSVPEDLTWTQIDAAAIENMVYMGLMEDEANLAWEPRVLGVTWVRSYWAPGSTWGTCLYRAKDRETVQRWHDLCGVAYAGIKEIELDEAGESDAYPRGFHAPRDAAPLVAIEGPGQVLAKPWLDNLRWIRTYRDPHSGDELQLFLPQGAPEIPSLEVAATVRRVVELRPSDYGGDEP